MGVFSCPCHTASSSQDGNPVLGFRPNAWILLPPVSRHPRCCLYPYVPQNGYLGSFISACHPYTSPFPTLEVWLFLRGTACSDYPQFSVPMFVPDSIPLVTLVFLLVLVLDRFGNLSPKLFIIPCAGFCPAPLVL